MKTLNTAKQPNSQTAKQPNSQTAKQPNSQTAKQPNSQSKKSKSSKFKFISNKCFSFLLIVFLTVMTLPLKTKSQSNSCNGANYLVENINYTLTSNDGWFKIQNSFSINVSTNILKLYNLQNNPNDAYVSKLEVYIGNCGNLSLYSSDSTSIFNDSLEVIFPIFFNTDVIVKIQKKTCNGNCNSNPVFVVKTSTPVVSCANFYNYLGIQTLSNTPDPNVFMGWDYKCSTPLNTNNYSIPPCDITTCNNTISLAYVVGNTFVHWKHYIMYVFGPSGTNSVLVNNHIFTYNFPSFGTYTFAVWLLGPNGEPNSQYPDPPSTDGNTLTPYDVVSAHQTCSNVLTVHYFPNTCNLNLNNNYCQGTTIYATNVQQYNNSATANYWGNFTFYNLQTNTFVTYPPLNMYGPVNSYSMNNLPPGKYCLKYKSSHQNVVTYLFWQYLSSTNVPALETHYPYNVDTTYKPCYCEQTICFTVHPNPNSFSVHVTPSSTICSSDAVTLTAIPLIQPYGLTYTWTFQGGLNSTVTGVNPVFTGNIPSTTHYTVAVSDSAGYCIKQFTGQIIVNNCCKNPSETAKHFKNVDFVPPGTPGAIPWNSLPISPNFITSVTVAIPTNSVLTGDFTFDGWCNFYTAVTFSRANCYMEDGAKIWLNVGNFNIGSSYNSSITNSYFHSCPNKMYEEIKVLLGGLSVRNSIFEDGVSALHFASTSIANSYTIHVPRISIINSLFNKNYIGLNFHSYYPVPVTLSYTSVNSRPPFTLHSCVFTSRQLLAGIVPQILLGNNINFPVTMGTALNGLAQEFLNGSSVMGITPGGRPFCGIYFIGNNTKPNDLPFLIGNASITNANTFRNYFDNLDNGIYSIASQFEVQNSQFQNMKTRFSGNAIFVDHILKNVYTNKTIIGLASGPVPLINNNKVDFINCNNGVRTINNKQTQNNHNLSINNSRFYSCGRGIWFSEEYNGNADIAKNLFSNTNLDFYVFNSLKFFHVNFNDNTLQWSNNYDMTHHILLSHVTSNAVATYTLSNNIISGKNIGIQMENVNNSVIKNNQITTNSFNFAHPEIANILLKSSNQILIDNNSLQFANNNGDIKSNVYGLRAQISSSLNINCNTFFRHYYNLTFENFSNSQRIALNEFELNNIPQIGNIQIADWNTLLPIGTIGTPFIPPFSFLSNKNRFLNNCSTIELNIFSLIGLSIYYNGNAICQNNQYPFNVTSNVTRIQTPLGIPSNCNNIGNPNPNSFIFAFNSIITNTLNPTNPFEKGEIYNGKRIVFDLARKNAITSQIYSNLPNFMQSMNGTNIDKFNASDTLIQSLDLSKINFAQGFLNSVNSNDSVEIVEKEFLKLYLNFIKNDTLLPSEVLQLKNIAMLCPYKDGRSVYGARALLRNYDTTEYFNVCENNSLPSNNNISSKFSNTENFQSEISSGDLIFDITPNPFNNTIYMNSSEGGVHFKLFDVNGKLIIEKLINEKSSIVNTTNIIEGTYFYMIFNKKGELIKNGKLIKINR
jgi:hypothetical protein